MRAPCLAALLLAAAIGTHAAAQEARFGDWSAGCAGDVCTAWTQAARGAVLSLSRAPAHAAHWSVTFRGVPPGDDMRLRLDGESLWLGQDGLWDFDGALEPAREVVLATLIPRIRAGTALRLEAGDGTAHDFSLAGATAALL